jgi:hypothetical protein
MKTSTKKTGLAITNNIKTERARTANLNRAGIGVRSAIKAGG